MDKLTGSQLKRLHLRREMKAKPDSTRLGPLRPVGRVGRVGRVGPRRVYQSGNGDNQLFEFPGLKTGID